MTLSDIDFSRLAFVPSFSQPVIDEEKLRQFAHENWHNGDLSDTSKIGWKAYSVRHFVKTDKFHDRGGYKFYRHEPDCQWFWDHRFAEEFPEITSWVESLPFRKLNWSVLVTQVRDIYLHKDRTKYEDVSKIFDRLKSFEPSGYRLLFSDPNVPETRTKSFYMAPNFDESQKIFCKMPFGKTAFIMNESRYFHGAKFWPGSHKTMMYITGDLDYEKHRKMVERSLKKYPDYALYFPATDCPEFRGNFLKAGVPVQDD